MTTSTAPCPHADRIDAYLDGDLDDPGTHAFDAHLDACEECQAELALALRLEAELAALPATPCPDDVFASALRRIDALERDRPARSRPVRIRRNWAVGFGLASLAAVLVAVPFLTTPAPSYSAAEIEQARQDVELAFALLADASRETSQLVLDDAFVRSADAITDALHPSR